MTIAATRFSAFLTGVWTALGMSAFEAWEQAQSQATSMHSLLFFTALVVFLFIPVVLFVIGPQYFRFAMAEFLTKEYWIAFKDSGVRGLWWFFGAAVAGATYSLVLLAL